MGLKCQSESGESINRHNGGHLHPPVPEMDISELFQHADEVTLLDVRDEDAYAAYPKVPEGTIRVSSTDLSWMYGLDRTLRYGVFCDKAGCRTSQRIAQKMIAMGFANVSTLKATSADLAEAGYGMHESQEA